MLQLLFFFPLSYGVLNVWQRLYGDCCVFTSLFVKKKCWDRTPKGTFSVLKMIGTYFDIGTFNIILSNLCQICRSFWKGKGKTHKYTIRLNQSTTENWKTVMTLTWYRHFQRNGGLNQILRRQTSRFHYGSKVPVVTITAFIIYSRVNMLSYMIIQLLS